MTRYCKNRKDINTTIINDDELAKALSKDKTCSNNRIRTLLIPHQNCKHDFILEPMDNDIIMKRTYWSLTNEPLQHTKDFCLIEYNSENKTAEICSDVKLPIW